ncbi:MAG: flagellar hook protein FlgE [Sphingopyxis sp.]
MSFYTSLSGLRGAQADLSTVSNNVANVGTLGFKRSRAQFGDIMPPSRTTPGLGTQLLGIEQQFTQGGYETTARDLDVAIAGPGFFMARQGVTGNVTHFTRNGSFSVNSDRFLVDATGAFVQVLPVDANGRVTSTSLGAARNLQLPLTTGAPRATTLASVAATLPNNADKPSLRPGYSATNPYVFNRADANSYNFAHQTTVYDAAGSAFAATLYFERASAVQNGDAVDSWNVHAFIGDNAATTTPITLSFAANGDLTSPSGPVSLNPTNPAGAAAPITMALDFGNATRQSVAPFSVDSVEQDGKAAVKFSDVTISGEGVITAAFSDGSLQPLGSLAIANFSDPTGLRQIGNARWTASGDSGPAELGAPGTPGFGGLQVGSLEQSNVDITEELVGLITAQRNFQANAKALEAANTLTQTVTNLQT